MRRYAFEAAHVLPWHPGKCSQLHGHSYQLLLTVEGVLDERGVVAEFGELDDLVEATVIDGEHGLDHTDLNRVIDNPTVERVAMHIAERLSAIAIKWTRLELWETSKGAAVIER
jgi:6-pyruvoyltetrahydropterin/6-carboxytetrahydropterin synthase